jgi:large subunit ribosomal protein L21
MYAVVKVQGFQLRVQEGDRLEVPRGPWQVGDSVELDGVLMLSDGSEVAVGTPTVSGAKVVANVLRHFRGPKVLVGKYKKRKDYRRLKGHRDDLTELEVVGISK